MKRSIPTGLIVLGWTLVPPLFAFQHGAPSGPPPPELPSMNQQYPGPLGTADFRKTVSGEFNGNLSRDAVIMDLNDPRLRLSAEYLDTSIGTGNPANDIAVLSGAIPGKDLLVTVELGGLKLYERNSATSSWSITTVRDGNSIWANAWRVAVGDYTGDGLPDIVGVGADKHTLLYLIGNGGLTFTTGPTVVLATQVIHQLLLMNWTNTNDAACTVEAVIFSNYGWACVEDNGLIRKAVSWTYSLGYGVVMDGPGCAPDRLVTTAVFAGTDRLSIYDETRTEGSYNLGALGIVAMATGDITTPAPDGDIDLILTTNTCKDVHIYENQSPSSTTFNWATPTKFQFGPANRNPALNQTGPEGIAVADFDSDDRLDILAPAQGDPNPAMTGVWSSVELIRPNYGYGMFQCQVDDPRLIPSTNPGVLPDQVRLTFHPPSTPLPIVSGQARDVLINVYYSAGLGAHPDLIPYPTNHHIPVPPSQGFQYFIFDLPLGYSLANSTGIFSLVAFQEVTQNGVMVDRGPATTGQLHPDTSMPIASGWKDTVQWYGVHDEGEEIPGSGAWEVGPTVPPVEDEAEPQEVPPPGG